MPAHMCLILFLLLQPHRYQRYCVGWTKNSPSTFFVTHQSREGPLDPFALETKVQIQKIRVLNCTESESVFNSLCARISGQ